MADRGFTIKKQLEPLGATLNIPSFLAGKDHLSQEEVTESQTIAAVRIHVERAIHRIKYFRQIRNEIPLTMHGSINQIWTVSCLLCNFMPPLKPHGSKIRICNVYLQFFSPCICKKTELFINENIERIIFVLHDVRYIMHSRRYSFLVGVLF